VPVVTSPASFASSVAGKGRVLVFSYASVTSHAHRLAAMADVQGELCQRSSRPALPRLRANQRVWQPDDVVGLDPLGTEWSRR
jgi:hypothetical protein